MSRKPRKDHNKLGMWQKLNNVLRVKAYPKKENIKKKILFCVLKLKNCQRYK